MRLRLQGAEAWLLVYRVALRLYPPSFRRRYGHRMLEDATDLLNAERAAGRSFVGPVIRIAADVMRSAPREWRSVWAGVLHRRRPRASAEPAAHGALFDAVASAVRTLRRRPGFALGIIALLGTAIGAGATVFSVVSAYLVRALPYPEPDRLVSVVGDATVLPEQAGDLFEIPVTWDLDAFTLVGDEGPELVYGAWVSRGYFEAFGVHAALGRLFAVDESGPGGASVAVISHDLWQRRYGGSPAVIGRTVRLFTSDRPDDAEVFTIVGVLARDSWHFNRYTEFLAPLRSDNPVYAGRLRRGVTRATAARVLEERSRAIRETVPGDFGIEVVPLQQRYSESVRPMLAAALGAVLLLLLVAFGNAAALLLVRAKARERELVIRRALGAGNGRLGRELLTEGLLLAGGACIAGLVLAALGLRLLGAAFEAHLGPSVPGGLDALQLDGRAFAATLAVTLLAGVGFGLVPLAAALRPALTRTLGDAGRASTTSRSRRRSMNALVAAAVALCVTLLVAAALAYRSVQQLAALELGFDPDRVFTASLVLRAASYADPADRAALYDRIATEASRLPGVEAAALTQGSPFQSDIQPRPFDTDIEGDNTGLRAGPAVGVGIGPGGFDALRIPLIRGRTFDRSDGPGAERVAIVSEQLARGLWPDGDAIGRRVRLHSEGPVGDPQPGEWHTVIGVVGDVRRAITDDATPEIYFALAQSGPAAVTVIVRPQEGSRSPLPALRSVVQRLDPTLALYSTEWLTERIAAVGRPARFLASFLGGFAAFTMAVTAVGLYAVLSFAASQRRRDLAIRMALGARRGQVLRRFLLDSALIVTAGLVPGLFGAAVLSRAIANQLHGVNSLHPPAYLAAAALLSVVAVAATWVPAHRAATVDPMTVLRDE